MSSLYRVLDCYVAVQRNPHSNLKSVYEAAMSLPQDKDRAVAVAQADGIVRAEFAATSWRAGVADAARELRELVVVHDNGGSGSSPKKIKDAARRLLTLLGES